MPTIFLPNPHHPHQRLGLNTRPLVDAGDAITIDDQRDSDLTEANLGQILTDLLADPSQRVAMRDALGRTKPTDGSETLADWIHHHILADER